MSQLNAKELAVIKNKGKFTHAMIVSVVFLVSTFQDTVIKR